jgi:hypothetical protein
MEIGSAMLLWLSSICKHVDILYSKNRQIMSSLGAYYSLLEKGINKTSKDHSNQDTTK